MWNVVVIILINRTALLPNNTWPFKISNNFALQSKPCSSQTNNNQWCKGTSIILHFFIKLTIYLEWWTMKMFSSMTRKSQISIINSRRNKAGLIIGKKRVIIDQIVIKKYKSLRIPALCWRNFVVSSNISCLRWPWRRKLISKNSRFINPL